MYLNVFWTLCKYYFKLRSYYFITLKMHQNSELCVKAGVGNGNPFQ